MIAAEPASDPVSKGPRLASNGRRFKLDPENTFMASVAEPIIKWETVKETIVGTVLRTEITEPEIAKAMGQEIRAMIDAGARRLVLNFSRTKYLSSTAFAVLLGAGKAIQDLGGAMRICRMDEMIRFGAGIIGLPGIVPILDDEKDAIASF